MRKALLACAALSLAVLAVPSFAQGANQAPQMTVQYSDLNMARSAGARTLLDRLKVAARIVCGYRTLDIKSLHALSDYRNCYDTAMDSAVHQVDNRMLAELYGKPTLVAEGHDNTVVASAGAPQAVVLSNR